jgi:hypothetical protein
MANNIARFNGTNWYALGDGLTGCTRFACRTEIYSLAASETDEVYAGGDFTTAGTLSSKSSRCGTARAGAHWAAA